MVLVQLEAALTESDVEHRSHQLRVAARNARRLQRLADQAIELTRLDAGTLSARTRLIEVVAYLESLVLSFGELAERKGILLEFIASPRSIRCEVDPDQLTTIVTNLLSNALKYTPAGGRIGVAVEARRGAGTDRLLVTVADTGPGVAPEQQELIFERFARGAEADAQHPGGAGIGLALSRELARIHGGTIVVESEPGRGARFIVELPLGHAAADAPAAAPLLLGGDDRPPITDEILHRTTGTGGMDAGGALPERATLLVVEDHADLRELFAAALADEGEVVPVADGSAALEQARELVPDLIVADVRIPGIDGIELCRRLRADERTSHIPLVLVSAHASVDRRVEGLEAGADAFLAKPVDPRELRARVGALLASRRELRERFREQVVIRPSDVTAEPADQLFLEKLVGTVEEEIGSSSFSVGELARELAMSVSQLSRKLSALIGQTPGQFIRTMRLERAATLVAAGAGTLSEIAYTVGFADQAHFSRSFKKHFGQTPSEYRRAAAGD